MNTQNIDEEFFAIDLYNSAWMHANQWGKFSTEVEAIDEAISRHLRGITYNDDDIR